MFGSKGLSMNTTSLVGTVDVYMSKYTYCLGPKQREDIWFGKREKYLKEVPLLMLAIDNTLIIVCLHGCLPSFMSKSLLDF